MITRSRWDQASNDLQECLTADRTIVSPVCSRVGVSYDVHQALAKQLVASEKETRRLDASWLCSAGTAIDPWLVHAASVFRIDMIRLTENAAMDADTCVTAVADRIDALRVRDGGKIENLLLRRLQVDPGSVSVAIDDRLTPHRVIQRLLDAGAVGRFSLENEIEIARLSSPSQTNQAYGLPTPIWQEDDPDWLVHCTRTIVGPWPGQSWRRYRDDLLLGSADPQRDVCQTLCRIVRTRCLVGGAKTSKHSDPVVCFSSIGLLELLSRRKYRSHLKRWDYEPWGLAIRRDTAQTLGIQPVVYGDATLYDSMPPDERFRYAAAGKSESWVAEQEWRHRDSLDLSSISKDDVRIFVPDEQSADRVAAVNVGRWPIRIVKSQHE